MTLLDASGLIDLLVDGPAATQVTALIEEGEVAIPSPNLAEVVDVMQRGFSVAEDELRLILDPLLAGPLGAYSPGDREAWRAGSMRARHYKRNRALSMCDALLIGSAAETGATLASGDRLLLEVATAEGVGVAGLDR